jgi:hypothetical protein
VAGPPFGDRDVALATTTFPSGDRGVLSADFSVPPVDFSAPAVDFRKVIDDYGSAHRRFQRG